MDGDQDNIGKDENYKGELNAGVTNLSFSLSGENISGDGKISGNESTVESQGYHQREEVAKDKPLSRKVKLLTVAGIYYGNIGLALVCHVHGPALTSFQKKYKTNDETISIVFSLMTGGIAAGALLSVLLFRFVNRQLSITLFFGGMGVCMFLIPFCPNLLIFFIVSGLMGFFGGFYSAAQFTWVLEMMQSECPPYVIAQHFFYAFGIILASLLMAPFLDHGVPGGTEFIAIGPAATGNLTEYFASTTPSNKLIIPFTIMAAVLILAMIFHLILFIFFRYHPPPQEQSEKNQNQSQSQENDQPNSISWKRIMLIIYVTVFCGSFKGMEDNVVAFLPKFAQNSPIHMSESNSAYLLSASMLSYTISRFVGIFILIKVPPRGVLSINMLITIICNILLITYAQHSLTILWITSIVFGIGFSTAYGCFSSYIEKFLNVTDAVGSLVLVYGAGIAALYPLLIGAYIEKHPVILGYTTFISIGICLVVILASHLQTTWDKKKY